MHGERVKKN